jgi:hypothetical protein
MAILQRDYSQSSTETGSQKQAPILWSAERRHT